MVKISSAKPAEKARTYNTGIIAVACVFFVGSLLGLSLVIAKFAVIQGAAPLPFLFFALMGSGLILLLAEASKGAHIAISRRTIEYGLVAGALFALPNAIGFLAVEHVGAGFLSLTFAFPILITYFLTLIIGMDRFKLLKALGVIGGLTGGLILAFSKVTSGESPLIWVMFTVMMPFIIAIGNVYRTLRWPSGVSSMYLAAMMLLGAAVLTLPFVILFDRYAMVYLFANQQIILLLAAQTGLFSVMYLFYFILQRMAGPVYLSQIGSVAAVVGTLVAIGFLGENAPQNIILAASIIIAGTLVFHLGTATRK